jgi:Na+/H+-dicarboxylate symporter
LQWCSFKILLIIQNTASSDPLKNSLTGSAFLPTAANPNPKNTAKKIIGNSKYQSTAHAAEQSTYGNHFIDTIVHIIPTNFFEALNKGELLPITFR